MANDQKLAERFEKYQPTKTTWFWTVAGAAVATMVVGFTLGGWTTAGTAQEMAENAAREARAEVASVVCVHRFATTDEASVNLAALKEVSRFQRDDFIEDGGWALLAGMDEAVPGAAELCAAELVAMDELPRVADTIPTSADG